MNIKRNVIENVGWQVFSRDGTGIYASLEKSEWIVVLSSEILTRMTANNFEVLLQLFGPSIKKQDTNMREAIPISTRLAVTLRFLATGDSYHTLMYIFRLSVPAISTIIPEVCQALIRSLKGYLELSEKVS